MVGAATLQGLRCTTGCREAPKLRGIRPIRGTLAKAHLPPTQAKGIASSHWLFLGGRIQPAELRPSSPLGLGVSMTNADFAFRALLRIKQTFAHEATDLLSRRMRKQMLTKAQVATRLAVSRATLDRLIDEGAIPAVSLGHRRRRLIRVPEAALESAIARLRLGGASHRRVEES